MIELNRVTRVLGYGSNTIRSTFEHLGSLFVSKTILWEDPTDLQRDSADYLDQTITTFGPEYFIVDLYRSDLNKPPSSLSNLISLIKTKFRPEQIILVQSKRASQCLKYGMVRNNVGDIIDFNNRLSIFEDYFVLQTGCSKIDLCDYYYSDPHSVYGKTPINYEIYFYLDIVERIKELINESNGPSLVDGPLFRVTLHRYEKYGDSLHRAFQLSKLFNFKSEFEKMVALSSIDFVHKSLEDLIIIHDCIDKRLDFTSILKKNTLLNKYYTIYNKIINGELISSDDYCFLLKNDMYLCENVIRNTAAQVHSRMGDEHYVTKLNIIDYLDCLSGNGTKSVDNINQPQLFDIWGSCVSREIVKELSDHLYLNNYVYRNSPLHAFDDAVNYDFSILDDICMFNGSRFRYDETFSELFRKAVPRLSKSNSHWIIVDLYDLIEKTFTIGGSDFILDYDTQNMPFGKELLKNAICNNLSDYDLEEMCGKLNPYLSFINNKYGGNIILVRCTHNKYFYDENDTLLEFDLKYEVDLKNEIIDVAEQYFCKMTNCYVIDISRFFFSDDMFVWGASPVHYELAFYREAAKIVEHIIRDAPGEHLFTSYTPDVIIEQKRRAAKANVSLDIIESKLCAHKLESDS